MLVLPGWEQLVFSAVGIIGTSLTTAFAMGRLFGKQVAEDQAYRESARAEFASLRSLIETHDQAYRTLVQGKLADLEARVLSMQNDVRQLDGKFTEFQMHRIEEMDKRYQQTPICMRIHELLREQMAGLPGAIIADERFRQAIRHEVGNGVHAGMGQALLELIQQGWSMPGTHHAK